MHKLIKARSGVPNQSIAIYRLIIECLAVDREPNWHVVKLSKERAWKEFGERLDDDFKTANKVFWQTIHRLRGKRSRAALFIEDSNGVTLKDQDAILNRWREYFSDLLNPVDATPIQIHEEQVGEDIQITEADVNAVIKSLKTGKAPGEDDIRPEMLKAMNIHGVRWLTRVCKVACSSLLGKHQSNGKLV